jgi:uncharacterized protein involved in exopolysaccharide biosynthesis
MSEDSELSMSELRRRRAAANPSNPTPAESAALQPASHIAHGASAAILPETRPSAPRSFLPFDPRRFTHALRRRWEWIALAGCLATFAGGVFAFEHTPSSLAFTLTLRDLSPRFTAAATDGNAYKPPQVSPRTMTDFLTSAELIRDVSSRARPAMTESALLHSLSVASEPDSETVRIRLTGTDPAALAALANLYTAEAVALSKDAQREDPALMYDNFTRQLESIETQEAGLNSKLAQFRATSGVTDPAVERPAFEKEWVDLRVRIDEAAGELDLLNKKQGLLLAEPVQKRLAEASAELIACEAQGKTDQHPDVVRLRNEIDDLNRQLTDAATNSNPGFAETLYASQAAALGAKKQALELEIQQLQARAASLNTRLADLYAHSSDFDQIKASLDRLENYRSNLNSRRFEAEQYRAAAEGYFQAAAPAQASDVDSRARYAAAASLGLRSGVIGILAALAAVLLLEAADPRLKTAADVSRVTRLPVLASLGNLDQMDEPARRAWAFRTWTILSNALAPSADHGALCGFISAAHGEGRSTWVELLAGAARERGFNVVRIDCSDGLNGHARQDAQPQEAPAPAPDAPSTAILAPPQNHALARGRGSSVMHVRLPGELWDPERRVQFRNELARWSETSNSVILVDLPPASRSEAVLLAENLPQIVWLADSGNSHARETRFHLNTLRHARCNLVGALLNHEPEPLMS